MNNFENEITTLATKNAAEITQWLSKSGDGMAEGIYQVYCRGQLDIFLKAIPLLLKQERKCGILIGVTGTVLVGGVTVVTTQIIKKIKQKKECSQKNEINEDTKNQTNDMEEQ